MNRYSHRRVLRRLALGGAVLSAGVALAACGGSGSGSSGASKSSASASGGKSSEVLNWAYTSDNPTWDPVVLGATGATQLLSTIYEPLFTLNPQGQVEPALATGFKFNPTGRQITITLRPGLTFQDGSPLNAQAVAFDINRAKTQSNSALKSDYAEIGSTTVINSTTLRLNLTQTDYQIPYILANRTSLLASEKAAKDNLQGLDSNDPVGAGPFKLVKLVPDASLTLEKWPGYWDAKDIHVSRINVSLNVNPATVLSGVQSGVYNFVTDLPAQDVATARKAGLKVVANSAAGWGAFFLSLNRHKAPFNNPLVVDAVQDAINRQQFVSQLGFGLATASVQPLPPTSPAYNPLLSSAYSYNPSKAKQLLAQAGYTTHPVTIPIDTLAGEFGGTPELVQEQLAAVGIKATIVAQPVTAYFNGYYGKTDTLAQYGYVGRDSPLEALDEHFSSAGILNLSAPQESAQYAAARAKVLNTPLTAPDYKAVLQAATKAGVETGSTVTLYTAPEPYATASSFSSFPLIDGSFRWNGLTIG